MNQPLPLICAVCALPLVGAPCACETPSFPLPAGPSEPFLHFEEVEPDGTVLLIVEPNSVVPPGARITVEALSLHVWVGGFAQDDGSFVCPVPAQLGDPVQISGISPDDKPETGFAWCLTVGNFGVLQFPRNCPTR